jgi:hypothetical protein
MLITYSGGPIVRCSTIYTSFWGPAWGDPFHTNIANQLNQFHQDYVASQAMNVITQYGISGGVYSSASYLNWVPNTLDPTSIQSIIQSCINAGALPEPGDPSTQTVIPILIVYLDENTIINGGGRTVNFPGAADYGYHDKFTTSAGHPFIYAFVGWFDINFTTVVASHEYAEMITDPLYNAWTPDGGFTEIGDVCESSNECPCAEGDCRWHGALAPALGSAPSFVLSRPAKKLRFAATVPAKMSSAPAQMGGARYRCNFKCLVGLPCTALLRPEFSRAPSRLTCRSNSPSDQRADRPRAQHRGAAVAARHRRRGHRVGGGVGKLLHCSRVPLLAHDSIRCGAQNSIAIGDSGHAEGQPRAQVRGL